MIVAIHQPQYLPWLGYFDKMDQSDVFVLLDDVQYKKNEWQNRNKIRNADTWQWLTVPVLYQFGQPINQVEIDNTTNWSDKHIKSIEINYSKAPHFEEHAAFFEETFKREWPLLEQINSHFIQYLKRALGIKARIVKSSTMDLETSGTQRLVDICSRLDADVYLSGAGGRDYLEEDLFSGSGIELKFQSYRHPEYEQVYEGFEPYMSVIDLLFTSGSKSIDIIREGREK
ncbi:MAG: hypothetical protein GF409_07230 [Candidatus Omnitrophica bacterium]|nr:hypothetical protein [Candidatus Omnitrophota bacterium]